MSSITDRNDARVTFLHGLIDDAALFPPAREPMAAAVAGHARHRESEYGWMQGRFLCPASRLEELAAALPPEQGDWAVGVILDGPASADSWEAGVEADLVAAAQLARWSDGRARPQALEVRLPDADPEAVAPRAGVLVGAAEAAGLPEGVVCYLEVPLDGPDVGAAVEAVAAVREVASDGDATRDLGAKVRCGGPAAHDLPPADALATFVDACARYGVPFKATAGLHHPLPRRDPATHGFLNVLGGGMLLAAGRMDRASLVGVLGERDALTLDAEALRWRDAAIDAGTIAALRGSLATGIGSCSFTEPVDDLRDLGVLPMRR